MAKQKKKWEKVKRAAYVPTVAPSACPLRADLLSPQSRNALNSEYTGANPFPHVVVRGLCQDDRMRQIRDEITNLSATFKETDIFRVYQVSQDLCCLNRRTHAHASLSNLISLRDALYTKEFRSFVSQVTGCGALTNKVDCSANFYSQGCHLLCHDDTIGTRRISYIIYLPDPARDWTRADGGCLELYTPEGPGGQRSCTTPSRVVLPSFNHMCMFRVRPGESLHSVQEVFSPDQTRISIQGWFHAAEQPTAWAQASRLLLQSAEPEVINEQNLELGAFEPLQTDPNEFLDEEEADELEGVVSDADSAELSTWMNPVYLKPQNTRQIRDQFTNNSHIQLRSFLRHDLGGEIHQLTKQADSEDRGGYGGSDKSKGPCEYDSGVSPGWSSVGPPQLRQYLRWEAKEEGNNATTGAKLGRVAHQHMKTPAFRRYLRAVTGLRCMASRQQVRRFRPGLGYTCANPGALTLQHRLDVTLCVVNEESKGEAELWSSGDVGGFQAYLPSAQEDNPDQAAVYQAEDDGGGLLQVPCADNTLNLVLHDPGTHKFVKYVSSSAPGSRWDIAGEYHVHPDDVGEGEDEGDEPEGDDDDSDFE